MKIVPLQQTSCKGEQIDDNSSGNMYSTLASVFLAFERNPVNLFNSLAERSFEASLCLVLGALHDLEELPEAHFVQNHVWSSADIHPAGSLNNLEEH